MQRHGADSDDVARSFRDHVARCSDMMSPASGVLLAVGFWREVTFGSILSGWHWSGPAQAVPGEIDAMGVVHEAVEDGVGIGRVADHLVPFVDGDLAGEEGRAAAVAFFEDFIEIAAGGGGGGGGGARPGRAEARGGGG